MDLSTRALALAVGWAAYFTLHSALASHWVKHRVQRRFPGLRRWYRLLYNGMAVVLILPLAWATLVPPSPELWAFTGWVGWVADAVALAALAGFVWTSRQYRMDLFLGTRQLRADADDNETFTLSPLHRFVRHPWYLLGLLFLWSRDMDLLRLVSATMITGYLFVGARLEEEKLCRDFGEAYREYRRKVPGIIPLPWRFLSRTEARRLTGTRTDIQAR